MQEQFGYAYDAAGNLNQRTNNALFQQFNVNNLNELSTVTRSGTLTVAGTTTSAATNVTVNTLAAFLYGDYTFAKDGFPLVNGTTNFTAIAQDVYGRADTNTVTVNLAATVSFTNDLNGNLISDGKRGFEWDDENELIRVTATNSWKKEYVYDGKHRMRIRKEFAWSGGSWMQTNEVRYIWDGDVIVQTRDTNNLPMLTFTRGKDLSGSLQQAGGIGGLLAMTENSGTRSFYHADGNGNIVCLISTNQFVIAKYLYDPFGAPLSESGPKAFVNPFWFSSQLYDGDTGFLHYKFRIYIPELQRWLNRDPIQEQGGKNLYEFLLNRPTIAFDIDGRFSFGIKTCGTLVTRALEPSDNPSLWDLFKEGTSSILSPHMFVILADGTRLTHGGTADGEGNWTATSTPIYIDKCKDCDEFTSCMKKNWPPDSSYTWYWNNCESAALGTISKCGGHTSHDLVPLLIM